MDKQLYHLRLRVECTLFCNLQSWAQHDMTAASRQGLPHAQALLQSSLTPKAYLIKEICWKNYQKLLFQSFQRKD